MPVKVGVDAGTLRVAFTGRDALWALRRGIAVPLSRVAGARVMARRDALRECPAMRLPGSAWPGRLHAGSYGLGRRRQLWCVHRAAEVLVIDLHAGGELSGRPGADRPYSRIVLEVGSPRERAGRINAAVAGRGRRATGEP